jgi:hypothetical protein
MGEKDKKEDGEGGKADIDGAIEALTSSVASLVAGPAGQAVVHAARLLLKWRRWRGAGDTKEGRMEMQTKALELDNRISAVLIEYRDKLNREEAIQGLALTLARSLLGMVAHMREEGKSPEQIHAAVRKIVDNAIADSKKDEAA